jgi:hypothetical protein
MRTRKSDYGHTRNQPVLHAVFELQYPVHSIGFVRENARGNTRQITFISGVPVPHSALTRTMCRNYTRKSP